ncbi:hypothetical protein J2S58_002013 [Nakamurella flavida]|uniref:monodechloroaminopyrrolnitrin synthase PrnB family protein n=1 Tax=Nakamurella flavida TaxID=363630 RepID=UPI00277DB780|nr:monodechloroaminopyrrolnitrin synthase PrnB family protein [Nakamurella flavida]MDP9778390.1 hypothetical protein [Nakamurella flavida]
MTVIRELRAALDQAFSAPGADARADELLAGGGAGLPDAHPAILDHDAVRAADPLGLDREFGELPAVNAAGDARTLLGWVRTAARRGDPGWAAEDAVAALRDAGMLLASLGRAGVDPSVAAPEWEPLLTAWALRTDMVPRDTVVHYGFWNPVGDRERRFLDRGPQEGALIQSVRTSCRLLPLAGTALDVSWRCGPTSPAGLAALAVMRDAVVAFAGEFARVRQIVDPHFFIEKLRPFFEPITVAGNPWSGPAAAFIPLYLVDEALWGGGEALAAMHAEALRYGRPEWRRARERMAARPALSTWLEAGERGDHTPELATALELTDSAVHALLRFRGQHVTTARRAYSDQDSAFRHGSGGFVPEDLKRVVDDERAAATGLHAAEQRAGA